MFILCSACCYISIIFLTVFSLLLLLLLLSLLLLFRQCDLVPSIVFSLLVLLLSLLLLLGNVTWFLLLEEAKVDIMESNSSSSSNVAPGWRRWLETTTAVIIDRVFKALSVPLTNKWRVQPFKVISELSDHLRQLEINLFLELDGVMLTKSYFDFAHSKL